MKKHFLSICLISVLFLITSCDFTFFPSESDNNNSDTTTEKPEKPSTPQNPSESEPQYEYTAENDIPAATAPFSKKLCTVSNAKLNFSNGNWKIVDIILRDYNSGIYDLKTITNVTYSNAEFICTSSISKYDIPATGINADDVNDSDYEILYNELFPNSLTRKEFSHGYLTENSIVLITNNKTQIFEEVYLSQLSTISAYPQFIKSNKEGTKYIIEYTGNGYPQTIYIYKDGDNSNDETIESDTNSSDDCTITFTVSTENQFIENNRLPLLMESGDWTLEATICIPSGNQYLNGQITLNENKEITFNSAELNMILSYDDFLVTMFSESELESMTIDQKISKCNQIVKMVSSSMPEGVTIKVTEDGVRMGQVYSDESELKQLYLELGLQTINSETEIMTNSSNTRYIITLTKLINPDENSQSTESEPYTRITTIYLSKN